MKRKIMEDLRSWKSQSKRKPLILNGDILNCPLYLIEELRSLLHTQ